MSEDLSLVIYTDGGARGNPGPAGIGAVFWSQDFQGNRIKLNEDISKFIGEATNNFAEYSALIAALEQALAMPFKKVICYLDSELVVKQLNGQYKIREESLKPLAARVRDLTQKFNSVSFTHVHREKNEEADKLVNEAIDKAVK